MFKKRKHEDSKVTNENNNKSVKNKVPFYKRRWFIILVAVLLLSALVDLFTENDLEPKSTVNQDTSSDTTNNETNNKGSTNRLEDSKKKDEEQAKKESERQKKVEEHESINKEFETHLNSLDIDSINEELKGEFSIKEHHPYILETHFGLNIPNKEISITAVIDPSMPESEFEELPDTLTRRFAWWVNLKDNYFSAPSADSLGGIYKDVDAVIDISIPGRTSNVNDILYYEVITSDNPKLLKKGNY